MSHLRTAFDVTTWSPIAAELNQQLIGDKKTVAAKAVKAIR
jgi:hypothetical protein